MIHRRLEALVVTPGVGDEPFLHQDKRIGADLFGFWRWAYSDLVSNATRGVLAEYIVGLALRCVDGCARVEWDTYDLRTPQGNSVEVKSAAYVQTWHQQELSKISFDITKNDQRHVRPLSKLCWGQPTRCALLSRTGTDVG